jgi:hypothetical protein
VLLTTVHCFGKRCVNTRVKLVKRLATSSLRDLKRLWLSRRVRVCVYVVTAIEIMIHDLSRFLGPLLFDCFTSLSRAAGFPLPLLLVYFFRQVPWCLWCLGLLMFSKSTRFFYLKSSGSTGSSHFPPATTTTTGGRRMTKGARPSCRVLRCVLPTCFKAQKF